MLNDKSWSDQERVTVIEMQRCLHVAKEPHTDCVKMHLDCIMSKTLPEQNSATVRRRKEIRSHKPPQREMEQCSNKEYVLVAPILMAEEAGLL